MAYRFVCVRYPSCYFALKFTLLCVCSLLHTYARSVTKIFLRTKQIKQNRINKATFDCYLTIPRKEKKRTKTEFWDHFDYHCLKSVASSFTRMFNKKTTALKENYCIVILKVRGRMLKKKMCLYLYTTVEIYRVCIIRGGDAWMYIMYM